MVCGFIKCIVSLYAFIPICMMNDDGTGDGKPRLQLDKSGMVNCQYSAAALVIMMLNTLFISNPIVIVIAS
jgi:hypothetical protein